MAFLLDTNIISEGRKRKPIRIQTLTFCLQQLPLSMG